MSMIGAGFQLYKTMNTHFTDDCIKFQSVALRLDGMFFVYIGTRSRLALCLTPYKVTHSLRVLNIFLGN